MLIEEDIKSIDLGFRWVVGVNYEYSYNCYNSNCVSSGICRCGTIDRSGISISIPLLSTLINSVRVLSINNSKKYIFSEIEQYCIERIFNLYKLYDSDSWDVSVCNGYYGEEIKDVIPADISNIKEDIKYIVTHSDIENIRYILQKEYKHLLDVVEDATTVVVEHVIVDDLIKNNDYFARIKNDVDYEIDCNLPLGVLVKNNGYYRLIDGYHRTSNVITGTYKYVVLENGA